MSSTLNSSFAIFITQYINFNVLFIVAHENIVLKNIVFMCNIVAHCCTIDTHEGNQVKE